MVWTGDDRVFFFNPTMQLSVWEKPLDLKNRGDLTRIIEDPPHKRKLEAPTCKEPRLSRDPSPSGGTRGVAWLGRKPISEALCPLFENVVTEVLWHFLPETFSSRVVGAFCPRFVAR